MLLNVIIPARNCHDTIERLLDSIVAQEWSKEDLEVIIADDYSDDNFMELVEPYKENLNIRYCVIDEHTTHCPSNTRKDGLSNAAADWVTFIDHDDMFEPMAFNNFKRVIEETGCSDAVCFNFRQYDIESDTYTREYLRTNTWLHGKFYNLDFLKSHNIDFKEDLESNEDLYFNALVLSVLVGEREKEYTYCDEYVYKWVNNPNSHSRKFFNEKYFYTDVYYKGYLDASVAPYIDMCKEYPLKSDFFLNQIMMNILHAYFYLQACVWRTGHDDMTRTNTEFLSDNIQRVHNELHMSYNQILQYVYKYPDRYHAVKKQCFPACGMFVEVYTFKELIEYVSSLEH